MKSTIVETILKLFNVSREEAELHASELINLAESKGGDISNYSMGDHQISKILGNRLEWRNEEIKQAQKETQKTIEKSYNNYLKNKNKLKW